MPYTWQASEFLTGNVIADLPFLDVPKVRKTLGAYDTTTATLPLPNAPENWLRATLHGGSVLSCIDTDADIPVWSGFVYQRPRNESDTLILALATVEAYFDRRFVGDKTYMQQGQNLIVTDLVSSFILTGSNGGIPARVNVVTAGNGYVRDRTYTDISDKSMYSVMTELMAVDQGCEWTVTSERQHNPERITFVVNIGDRIGNPVTPGLAPNAVFDIPGSSTTMQLLEDYSSTNAGNDFLAVSTAVGNTRPQSTHVLVNDPDRPTFERRFTPSTSITDVNELTQHAQAMAALQGGGTDTLTIVGAFESAPRIGVDWGIGDDIGYDIGGTHPVREDVFPSRFDNTFGGLVPLPLVPAFPNGLVGTVRAIGFEMTFAGVNTITPILQSVGGSM